jgi:predicted O-methyltransferase YrrM
MEFHLNGRGRVLEFGGGFSTPWFAARCDVLLTLETSRAWADLIEQELLDGRHVNVQVLRVNHVCDITVTGVFDLALVDCVKSQRHQAALYGWMVLKEGGWLVFDDAQRSEHKGTVRHFDNMRDGTRLGWDRDFDIPQARERLAVAWQK